MCSIGHGIIVCYNLFINFKGTLWRGRGLLQRDSPSRKRRRRRQQGHTMCHQPPPNAPAAQPSRDTIWERVVCRGVAQLRLLSLLHQPLLPLTVTTESKWRLGLDRELWTTTILEVKLPERLVSRSFGRSVGWTVSHNFIKGREVSLSCSYRSTCYHMKYV